MVFALAARDCAKVFRAAMQLALGFGSYWLLLVVQGAPQSVSALIWTTTAHVSVGALLLGDSLLLTLLAYRKLAAPGKALSFSQSPQKIVA